MATTRTRQIIAAEAARYEGLESVLRDLRQQWQAAPVGLCDNEGHGEAVRAVQVTGSWLHLCQSCSDEWDRSEQRAIRRTRERSSRAAAAGIRSQTQHRQ